MFYTMPTCQTPGIDYCRTIETTLILLTSGLLVKKTNASYLSARLVDELKDSFWGVQKNKNQQAQCHYLLICRMSTSRKLSTSMQNFGH